MLKGTDSDEIPPDAELPEEPSGLSGADADDSEASESDTVRSWAEDALLSGSEPLG